MDRDLGCRSGHPTPATGVAGWIGHGYPLLVDETPSKPATKYRLGELVKCCLGVLTCCRPPCRQLDRRPSGPVWRGSPKEFIARVASGHNWLICHAKNSAVIINPAENQKSVAICLGAPSRGNEQK